MNIRIAVAMLIGCLGLVLAAQAMPVYFKDAQYSFQLLRALGGAPVGYSDIGECLKTAYRIKEGDDEGWYREWLKTAQQVEARGNRFLSGGDRLAARECYFRASNYYRCADFFLRRRPNDRRAIAAWRKSRDVFRKAIRHLDKPLVRVVGIPYEGTELPGYLCLVDDSGKKRPLLIIHSGFDGTAEEIYFNGLGAIARGINVLVFEGPGQGGVVREQRLYFRPDWEKVVTPVVDYAVRLPTTDPKRIALMGISFGGYLAPRAAAFEPRIKVCIANSGVYDFHASVMARMPAGSEQALDDPRAARELDKGIYAEMKKSPGLRWVFGNGMMVFGAGSPTGFIKKTRPYSLKGVAEKIKCRMLVVDSEGDKDMPGQAKQLYRALRCPRTFMLFTREEGAEEHCQMGAAMISSERIYSWLVKVL